MNSYNNLARWTLPTTASEKAFYAKHAPTIDRYGFSLKVIQAVWICFSVNPTTKLLWNNLDRLPFLQALAPILAVALLGFMHYILHHEVIETLSNWQDKDETTVNGFMNWIIPIVLLIGLGLLDVKGVTATLRTDGFDGKKAANSVEAKALLADARNDYDKSLTNIATNRREDSTAALAPFQKRMTATKRLPLNDAQDIRAKNKAVQTVNDDWRIKLAEIRQKATDDTRTAEAAYNAEKNRINGKSDSTETAITKADADDKASSESHGWWITVFFMLVFLFMSYKYVILRVDSGIRRNMQFTELDAQGGFLEKLSVVIANIWQRQGHRFLTFLHELGSTGASELRDFDGNVILKASNYNGGGHVNAVNAANTQELPPTTPPLSNTDINPTPPTGGGGGNGGGGNNRPQSPTPQPTGGNALAAPIVREADVAVAEIKRQFQRFTTLPENTRVNIALDLSRDFQLPYVDMERILTEIDPECTVKNAALEFIETEHFGELGMAVGNLKNAQKAAFEAASTPPRHYLDFNEKDRLQIAFKKSDGGAALEIQQMFKRLRLVNPLIDNNFDVVDDVAFQAKWKELFEDAMKEHHVALYGSNPQQTDASVTTNQTLLPVVTANTSVVTDKEPQTEFSYGDNLLKSLKQKFQKDLNNLKTGNGATKSIMERLLTQSKEFDIAVRDVKATFKVKTEICEWVGENVQPLISDYLNDKEVDNG